MSPHLYSTENTYAKSEWFNGQRVQYYHCHYLLNDDLNVYSIAKNDNKWCVQCNSVDDPNHNLWIASLSIVNEVDNVLSFTQDDKNLYVILTNKSKVKNTCVYIRKNNAKAKIFHSHKYSVPYTYVGWFILTTPNYVLLESKADRKVSIFNKDLFLQREISWAEEGTSQTIAIYGHDNHLCFEVKYDKVFMDVRPHSAPRIYFYCYCIETGDLLYRVQTKAVNIDIVYMGLSHWCFSGTDGESKVSTVVDLSTGEFSKLQMPSAMYLVEYLPLNKNESAYLLGFCKIDAFTSTLSYVTVLQQRTKPVVPEWVAHVPLIAHLGYSPNVQIQAIKRNDSNFNVIIMIYGSNGCYIICFDMHGSIVWIDTVVSKTNKNSFSHFDVHFKYKVVRQQEKHRIIVHGTIREMGYFIKEYDCSGNVRVDTFTTWNEYACLCTDSLRVKSTQKSRMQRIVSLFK
ncbi:pentatricopeptide repeat-containing protein [Acrasis kona]|uniref:Pentatricopeptide repeat-containing protein n=1 Tax=Acrasis kona TaxID=1008807 RepID=A0AAW2ZBD6_9EUKA